MKQQRRIAICISGQVRSTDEKLAMIAEQAKLVGADVFISVWKERGGKTFESGPRHLAVLRVFGEKMALFFPKNWSLQFEDVFPNWRELMPDKTPLSDDRLKGIFPNSSIEIENDKPELDLPVEKNSLRMLYKIFHCNKMKREFEKQHGFTYDIVIRVRPDMLIDFKTLLDANPKNGDLLVYLRRGESMHDKYWAGTSETDNIMADFYNFACQNRLEAWKGIHDELTDYVTHSGLNPINTMCTISDFREFGKYTQLEQCHIIQKFKQQINGPTSSIIRDRFPKFTLLADAVLTHVSDFVCKGSPMHPSVEIVKSLEELLAENTKWENAVLLLPVVTLAFACDQELPPEDRAKLAQCILVNDALSWRAGLGFRTRHIVEVLPDRGAELLPLMAQAHQSLDLTSTNQTASRLFQLWQQHRASFDDGKLIQAQKDVLQLFLGDKNVHTVIQQHLQEQNRLDELLKLSEMILGCFPDRQNSRTFNSYAQRLLAKSRA